MKRFDRILPHVVAFLLFIAIPLAYFYPQIQGKRLAQHDIAMWKGSAKEILDYKQKTGEQTLWTNSMFGGMPAYLISADYNANLLRAVHKALHFINTPASFIFVTMAGFYILLLVFGVNPWLGIIGSIAYGFSTYFFIVIGAGHNAKIAAIGYVAPMIAGMVLALRGKYLSGLALFALFLGLNLVTGHPQITYYAAFIMAAIYLSAFYQAYTQKALKPFVQATAVLGIALVLAVGANFSRLWFTYDYGKESIRGKSELTDQQHDKTSGLDRSYATQWSYGPMETFNLLIPNLVGGASAMNLGDDSKTFTFLRKNGVPYNQVQAIVRQLPTYWGPQPSTSGPVYLGAVVIFFFALGIALWRNPLKIPLLVVAVLALLLAWGNHFNFLTNLFMDYFPAYNKFRTVSMILVIVELIVPFVAIMGLKELLSGNVDKKGFLKSFKRALGVVAGICLFFLIFGRGMFDFSSTIDQSLGWPEELIKVIKQDRMQLLTADSFRSLLFVLLAAAITYIFYIKKLKQSGFLAFLALLVIVDMWPVNRRYMDNSNFILPKKVEAPFNASAADKKIMADPDPDFRVFNMTVSPFNDASTSYFHKSIGGYHGAKLRRYQDLIDRHLSQGNMAVFNMLNTKYIIQPGKDRQPVAVFNPEALGHAWFVDSVIMVNNADEEIAALQNFNPRKTAIVDRRFASEISGFSGSDSTQRRSIQLLEYYPNRLVYRTVTQSNQLAVFSEIYYPKGWSVTIDGKPATHFRVNYILRAMIIPAGEHNIEFRFDPPMWDRARKVDLLASLVILLLLAAWITRETLNRIRKEKEGE